MPPDKILFRHKFLLIESYQKECTQTFLENFTIKYFASKDF